MFKNKTIKRNMQKMFTEKVDEKLINLVKANPVLYDFNDHKYMDFNTREVAWQKIGDELEKPAADCKVRWINIRDVHRRILRKRASRHGGKPIRAYKYDKLLNFMRDYYKEVVSANPGTDEEEEEDKDSEVWNDAVIESPNEFDEEDTKPILKPKPKRARKRKISKIEEVDVSTASTTETYNDTSADFDGSDPVDAFLLSIGATLKKFTPYHLNVAKSKIFNIVQEHDLQQIVERQQGKLQGSMSNEQVHYLYPDVG